jgi:hypothetical protein
MAPTSLHFELYWRTPELVVDFDILLRCGRVQASAAERGVDTPAGWFDEAARVYSPADAGGALARRTCELVASAFAHGEPN